MVKKAARKTLNIAHQDVVQINLPTRTRRKSMDIPLRESLIPGNMEKFVRQDKVSNEIVSSETDVNDERSYGKSRKSCGNVFTGKRKKSLSNKLENVLNKKMSLVTKVSRGIKCIDVNYQIAPTPLSTCIYPSVGSSGVSKDSGVGSTMGGKNIVCKPSDSNNLEKVVLPYHYSQNINSSRRREPICTRLRGFGYPHDMTIECPTSFILYEKLNLGSSSWLQLVDSENLVSPRYFYFRRQRYITSKTRSILLDWLSEVCEAFRFKNETYYMAVEYVDRYLALDCDVRCSHLQLIGISCLFISSKIEEIFPPSLNHFVDVTDGAAKADDILNQEVLILQALSWQIIHMNSYKWLILFVRNHHFHIYTQKVLPDTITYCKMNKLDVMSTILSNDHNISICDNFACLDIENITLLLEVAILDEESLKYPNIVLASSIFYLFYKCDDSLEFHTGFKSFQLHTCIDWLSKFYRLIELEQSKNTRAHPLSYGGLSASKKESTYYMHYHRKAARILSSSVNNIPEDKQSPVTKRNPMVFR